MEEDCSRRGVRRRRGPPFFDPSTPYSAYYVLDFMTGTGSDDFIAIVPAVYGHYGQTPVPGVSIQTQVAP